MQHKKTISKSTALRKTNPLPQFKAASYKRSGIRLSFDDNNTASGGRGREDSPRLRCLEKCSPSMQFFLSFVDDFSFAHATQNSLNIPLALQALVTYTTTYTTVPFTIFHDANFNINFEFFKDKPR